MTEIQLSMEFSSEFAKLQKRAEKGDGGAEYLLKLIDKGIARLVENHEAGQKIQRKLWPRYYTQKYGINNLWRIRLDDYWRMIYTVIGEKVRIVAVILEVLDHREYNKRFGYK
jgi:mRNA-degrading endonuclease RelE of RelBE toxin-antitoxin system